MADPNLPEEQSLPRQRKKKLPPLKGEQEENKEGTMSPSQPPTTEGEGASAAPRPRKKKRRPKPAQHEASQEETAEAVDEQLLQTTEQPQRPRKKKVKRTRPPQPDETQGDEARRSPDGQEEATATPDGDQGMRTRHIDVEGMPLATVLEAVRDDVVTKGEGHDNLGADFHDDKEREAEEPANLSGQAVGDSNLSDTIFRQAHNARTFKAEKIEKYQQRVEQERKEREQYLQGEVEEDMSNSTLKCAIGFTKVFNYLGTILIGLMPGFCAFHTMYVWVNSNNYITFVRSYYQFSTGMTIFFYVALTICIISILERYDTGKMDAKSCLECVSFRHAGMVIILYMPAYLISNGMYPISQWIGQYANNATAYENVANGESLIQGWRIMDTVRTALVALGWLIVAFDTRFNKLVVNLQSELDDLIGDDQAELGAGRSHA